MCFQKKSKLGKFFSDIATVCLAISLIMFLCSLDGIWKIIILIISFIIYLATPMAFAFDFKINMNLFFEKINMQKSKVRICKAKYVQTLNQVEGLTSNILDPKVKVMKNVSSINYGAFGGGIFESEHKSSIALITKLADEYANQQELLSRMIEEYNSKIINFPTSLFARIYKIEKLAYVAQDSLEKSTVISDNIDNADF